MEKMKDSPKSPSSFASSVLFSRFEFDGETGILEELSASLATAHATLFPPSAEESKCWPRLALSLAFRLISCCVHLAHPPRGMADPDDALDELLNDMMEGKDDEDLGQGTVQIDPVRPILAPPLPLHTPPPSSFHINFIIISPR